MTEDNSRIILESAIRTIYAEKDGLMQLADALTGELGSSFVQAVKLLFSIRGRIIVTGMGKSGHIGRKVAATLASTGTAAYYVHPGEASHGDLGMISKEDAIIALSWSGEAAELGDIIFYAARYHIPLIAVTANTDSALAKGASLRLILPKVNEASPDVHAPTTSTAMQLALCDALAVALIEKRGFTAEDFKIFHPGGRLGAQLKSAEDIMHKGNRLPLVYIDNVMRDVITEISLKNFGCAIVLNREGYIVGVVTDGDLRRNLRPELPNLPVEQVMTKDPKTVPPTMLVAELLVLQETMKITSLIVAKDNKPLGLVHYLDLLRVGAA